MNTQLSSFSQTVNKKLLDNRTIVLYPATMKEKRTIQTVQKSIAAFFRQQRRMPSYQEMVDLLGRQIKKRRQFLDQ